MNSGYISKLQSNVIKGLFILIVFFSHFQQYVAEAGGRVFNPHLGQLMVVMFLFYSGFGVMEQIAAKGHAYVQTMPNRRMLATLLNFDVAVMIFIGVDLLIGRPIELRQAILSFVCWESVGNSNWYVFTIILCYGVTWGCFKFLGGRAWAVCVSLVFVVLALSAVRPSWWYDTMLCFPAGLLYSIYKKRIECLVKKHYWLMLVMVFVLFLAFRHCGCSARGLTHNAQSVCFCLFIVFVLMKLPVKSSFLGWCGVRLFPIYIYQRLPMIALFQFDKQGFATWRAWCLYLPICLVVTLLTARWYNKWQIKL